MEREFAQGAPAARARLAGGDAGGCALPAGNQDGGQGLSLRRTGAAGYRAAHNGQKTYNGVAILARGTLEDVRSTSPISPTSRSACWRRPSTGCAWSAPTCPTDRKSARTKYAYKLRWLAALKDHLRGELQRFPQLALLGDYNIAPDDRDVHDPVAWKDQILCSEPERAAFRQFVGLGLADAFRLFEQPPKLYSWWDYRQMGFRLNRGLRIDHILLSTPLVAACSACAIDKAPRKLERPSDHAPVMASIDLQSP
jgi:exodeoxyribonuclease-3